jgi:hypothetical protein
MSGNIEINNCSFCHESKPVQRLYIHPKNRFKDGKEFNNSVIICYCSDCGIDTPEKDSEELNKTHYLDELPNIDKASLLKMCNAAIPKLKLEKDNEDRKTYPIITKNWIPKKDLAVMNEDKPGINGETFNIILKKEHFSIYNYITIEELKEAIKTIVYNSKPTSNVVIFVKEEDLPIIENKIQEIQKQLHKMENKELSIGEQRVRTSFNPSQTSAVDKIKQKTAELINLLDAERNDTVSKYYGKSREQMNEEVGEKLRLISIAQTEYENAAMWAVKAATS